LIPPCRSPHASRASFVLHVGHELVYETFLIRRPRAVNDVKQLRPCHGPCVPCLPRR
jgi:hypothetical protein